MMMKKKKYGLKPRLWLSALVVVGIGSNVAMMSAAYADIVTSIRPLGFIASSIADGVMPTQVLLPDGASPHDYALRPSDLQRVHNADLVVWVGPDMEAFLTKTLRPLKANQQIAISELVTVKPLLQKGDDHDDDGDPPSDYNMHLWLSPEISLQAAIAIHDRLVEIVPAQKSKLDENLQHFKQQLAQTDQKIGKILSPVRNKGYFVFHDAYGYFENHFGLHPLGHFTINPEIQPGAQHLHEIRTQLVEQKAQCVFAEPQFRPAVIDAVARGTQVRLGTLDPLGIGVALGPGSYVEFLSQLAAQYASCLKGN